MKIESVRIQNFRCFKDETINFDNYTCFIGPNGSGKSTVLMAINIFFRQNKDVKTDVINLNIEDFNHKNITEPIIITVTFCDLSEKAKTDFKDYVRQDKLIITAKADYNPQTGSAEVKQYGNRLGIYDFRELFTAEKDGKKVDELKEIYNNLRTKYIDLPIANTKEAIKQSLWDYESIHKDNCTLLQSEDQFYGISRGKNRLESHIQWVFYQLQKILLRNLKNQEIPLLANY